MDDFDFDTQIAVFQGSSCDQLLCVTGNDDGDFVTCGFHSNVTFFAHPNTTYYVLVHGYDTGNFVLNTNLLLPEEANLEGKFCDLPLTISIRTSDNVILEAAVVSGALVSEENLISSVDQPFSTFWDGSNYCSGFCGICRMTDRSGWHGPCEHLHPYNLPKTSGRHGCIRFVGDMRKLLSYVEQGIQISNSYIFLCSLLTFHASAVETYYIVVSTVAATGLGLRPNYGDFVLTISLQ